MRKTAGEIRPYPVSDSDLIRRLPRVFWGCHFASATEAMFPDALAFGLCLPVNFLQFGLGNLDGLRGGHALAPPGEHVDDDILDHRLSRIPCWRSRIARHPDILGNLPDDLELGILLPNRVIFVIIEEPGHHALSDPHPGGVLIGL